MESIVKQTLRELYGEYSLDIDPREIMPAIRGVASWDFCNKLTTIEPRQERVDMFMDEVFNTFTLEEFFEVLQFQDAYTFLVGNIEGKLKQKVQDNEVYTTIKIKLFTEHRKELVEFRHVLKTYSLTGRHAEFSQEVTKVIDLWNDQAYRRSLSVRDRQKLADRYFFVRDAQCENMRLQYDTKKVSKTDVLNQIRDIAPHTTNPTLTTMMFLARKGSALIMQDPSAHHSAYIDFIEIAEQHTELVPACRETGLVHYIKYNFKGHEYEECPNPETKILMLKVAGKAVDHFCREYEKVSADFKNIFKIKISHLHLGIGILAKNMRGIKITQADVDSAKAQLDLLTDRDIEALSHRWRWGLRVAEAKIFWFKGDFVKSLEYAERALHYARAGNFTKEIEGTKEMIEFLKDGKPLEYLENLSPLRLDNRQSAPSDAASLPQEFKAEPTLSKNNSLVLLESDFLCGANKNIVKNSEIYKSLTKTVKNNEIKGLQKTGNFWTIYLLTRQSQHILLQNGVTIRDIHVKLYRRRPKFFSLRIMNFPLSENDDIIFEFLKSKGLVIRGYYRERLELDGVMTDCQTGDRILKCEDCRDRLAIPRHVKIGKFDAQIVYKGQIPDDNSIECRKCFEPGHIQENCKNYWICYSCGEIGHEGGKCKNLKVLFSDDDDSDLES